MPCKHMSSRMSSSLPGSSLQTPSKCPLTKYLVQAPVLEEPVTLLPKTEESKELPMVISKPEAYSIIGQKISEQIPVPELVGDLVAGPCACCMQYAYVYYNFLDLQCWVPEGLAVYAISKLARLIYQ